MNAAEKNLDCTAKIDASCRVPLLVLFNGAAVALVFGLLVSLLASLTFHNPEITARCAWMSYGHAVAAANDLLVYGFAIPAALGVILWIFARLSQAELALPIVVFAAAHLWQIGVLVGTIAIFTGNSSGHQWLEYPRAAAALLGVAFVLITISAFATFGLRKERELYPSHWFLLAALLWFPWIYSSANLFLGSTHPVRGVAQSVINWWFANNLILVWFALVGLGIAFYFLPKISGRPLHSRFYALFAFWTLIVFGTWLGIPAGAPVPAWFPAASQSSALLLILPLITLVYVLAKTPSHRALNCLGGTYCYIRLGSFKLLPVALLMAMVAACPQYAHKLEFTWFGPAQAQLEIFAVSMILLGAIYEIIPRTMGVELPFKKWVGAQFFLSLLGIVIWVGALALAGAKQAHTNFDPAAPKFWLMMSSTGSVLLLLGSLVLLLNLGVMTFKWHIGVVKTVIATVTAPLPKEVKS